MRPIKFRGLWLNNKEWVEGYYCYNEVYERGEICNFDVKLKRKFTYIVDPETVGEFAGLLDKNGKEIYEGDIINAYPNTNNQYLRKIVWNEELVRFQAPFSDGSGIQLLTKRMCLEYEIIGNVHQNPDLLKETK